MSLNNTHEIEFPLSLTNIQDQIASFLYATGRVHDNEEVDCIEFGNVVKDIDGNQCCMLKVTIRKEELRKENGGKKT